MDERYLKLLSEKFPNAQAVITELINLRAILSLPKGTEHFVSDLHGASMAFIHMIKNGFTIYGKINIKIILFYLLIFFVYRLGFSLRDGIGPEFILPFSFSIRVFSFRRLVFILISFNDSFNSAAAKGI